MTCFYCKCAIPEGYTDCVNHCREATLKRRHEETIGLLSEILDAVVSVKEEIRSKP